jgi:hypothetical protein
MEALYLQLKGAAQPEFKIDDKAALPDPLGRNRVATGDPKAGGAVTDLGLQQVEPSAMSLSLHQPELSDGEVSVGIRDVYRHVGVTPDMADGLNQPIDLEAFLWCHREHRRLIATGNMENAQRAAAFALDLMRPVIVGGTNAGRVSIHHVQGPIGPRLRLTFSNGSQQDFDE